MFIIYISLKAEDMGRFFFFFQAFIGLLLKMSVKSVAALWIGETVTFLVFNL